MRICQITSRRDTYGGEVCLANLAHGLRARGHQVTCVVRPDSQLARELPAAGLPVRPLPLLGWYDPVTTCRLAAWLRQERIDVIHAHNPRDWFIAAAASAGGPAVCVGTRHILRPVSHLPLKRSLLRRLGALIAVSGAVREAAAGLVEPARLVVVPNGVELPGPSPAAGLLGRELGLQPGQPVLGMVARLAREKGHADLLRAAALLRRRWPGLEIVLVGEAAPDSGYGAELRRLAATLGLGRNVHFCGYRPRAVDLASAFDIHVLPSVAEPCGLATLEAMSQGVPVVATGSGGSPELIDDGVEGFLVPPRDPARLADALACLLESRALRQEMGSRGKARVVRDFGIALMAERTESVYREAVERAAG